MPGTDSIEKQFPSQDHRAAQDRPQNAGREIPNTARATRPGLGPFVQCGKRGGKARNGEQCPTPSGPPGFCAPEQESRPRGISQQVSRLVIAQIHHPRRYAIVGEVRQEQHRRSKERGPNQTKHGSAHTAVMPGDRGIPLVLFYHVFLECAALFT